jgi:hypothetical protein
MTSEQWQTCSDLDAMLTAARRRGHFSARKRRLFACACCQRLGRLLPDAHRRALAVAERFADGRASRAELAEVWSVAYHDPMTLTGHAAWAACTAARPGEGALTQGYLSTVSLYAANALSNRSLRASSRGPDTSPAWHVERARHRALLRDVAPPPRGARPLPRGLPPAAPAVARSIYEERRFAELPILADLLEESGMVGEEVVAHCRRPGEHVRGCWALDLLLGLG